VTDKVRLKKIAEAYLIESQSDRAGVSALIKARQYNLAIYHVQQSIEKLPKPVWQEKAKSESISMKYSLSLKKPLVINLRKMK